LTVVSIYSILVFDRRRGKLWWAWWKSLGHWRAPAGTITSRVRLCAGIRGTVLPIRDWPYHFFL